MNRQGNATLRSGSSRKEKKYAKGERGGSRPKPKTIQIEACFLPHLEESNFVFSSLTDLLLTTRSLLATLIPAGTDRESGRCGFFFTFFLFLLLSNFFTYA